MFLKIVFLLACAQLISTLRFPSYISKCSRSDPNLNQCAATNGNEALKHIIKGDKKYRIPNLAPMEIPEITMDPGNGLKIHLTNCTLYGLETAVIKNVDFDFDKSHAKFIVDIDRLTLLGTYDITGRILLLPISGRGPANITFANGIFDYNFDYKLAEKKNAHYLEFLTRNLEFTTKRNYYRLDNLFNGNEVLGQEMNRVLDENWKEVTRELYSSLKQTINGIITPITLPFFSKVPFDDLFLP